MSLKKINEKRYSTPTRLIYGRSKAKEWNYDFHVLPPVTATSTFRLGSAQRGAEGFGAIGQGVNEEGEETPIYVYDRMGNPNTDMLQHALAVSEGTDCAVVFASGMAAVHAGSTFLLRESSEIISHNTIYGCSYSLFSGWMPRFGIKVHFCDLTKPDSFLQYVTPRTRVLYLESPVNPNLELLDLDAIAHEVKKVNRKRKSSEKIVTVIDNTFATPYCQRPISHGIDVVIHSLTKGISGFGEHLGGAVVTRKEFEEELILFRKDFGGMMAPMTAWGILVHGVSTMALRIPKQQANAQRVAAFLESHPKIDKVRYPGLTSFPQHEIALRMLRDYNDNFAPGFMVYFNLRGKNAEDSKRRGERMMDFIARNAYCVTLAVSLGQLRTLIEHPGSMTHAAYPAKQQEKLGIDPGGIRLAVGVEDPDDIIRDLDAALRAL